MDPQRHARIKDLFAGARELFGEEREAYLSAACAGDEDLRREVEELLSFDESSAKGVLGRALGETTPSSATPERIGNYRILGICGHGGMGTVFEAEQDSPRRRVALKVIQSVSAGQETLSRFRREAEILGRLRHPGIAQILEAGEFLHDGLTRPFIAMEFVEGLPLIAYAERYRLDRMQRLELFARICEAVDHAHQQQVVHRDLKPDNVLVVEGTASGQEQGSGLPKVLDFGVARLLGDDLHSTISTHAGQLLGSVPYMSPEQAGGDPRLIDPRSDVYSLGVMLFELLSGELPHDIEGHTLADALDRVRHREPKRLGSIDVGLRGDLETITTKCLEGASERRYGTAAQLAEDLRRHLGHEPIRARPPSSWYQWTKFARRNQGLVAGALIGIGALVAGLVISLVFAFEASRNARVAGRALERAQREAYRANLTAASALLRADPEGADQALAAVPAPARGWEWEYLNGRLAGQLLDFGRHRPGTSNPFAQAPLVVFDGGRQAATAADDARVEVWECMSGTLVDSVESDEPVARWGIGPEGRRVAAGMHDGRVLLFDRGGDREWTVVAELEEPVFDVVLQPDGPGLALATPTRILIGTSGNWRELHHKPQGLKSVVLEFSPDGRRLGALVPWTEDTFHLWDTETDERLIQRIAPVSARCFAFHPDGDRIAFGGAYREIVVLQTSTGELSPKLIGHEKNIRALDCDAAGRLVSASEDGTVRLWDLDQGRTIGILSEPGVRRACFTAENRILTGSAERLRLWSLEPRTSKVLGGHDGYVYHATFSGDGSLVATYCYYKAEVSVWEVATGELLARRVAPKSSLRLNFDQEGAYLWLEAWSKVYRLDWAGGAPVERRPEMHSYIGCSWSPEGQVDLGIGQSDRVLLDMSPAPAVLRTEFTSDGGVRLVVDGEEQEVTPFGEALDLGAAPRLFVGAGLDRHPWFVGELSEILVYDGALSEEEAQAIEAYLQGRRSGGQGRRSGETTHESPPSVGPPVLAHFRADEEHLSIDPVSGAVVAWRSMNDPSFKLRAHGAQKHQMRYSDENVPSVRFLPFSGQLSRRACWLEGRLPEFERGAPLTVFTLGRYEKLNAFSIGSHEQPCDTTRPSSVRRTGPFMSYSADGGRVAIGHLYDGQPVLVRDVASGDVLFELDGLYLGVALSPDGKRLVCGDSEGVVELWDIDLNQRLARDAGHAGRVFALDYSPDGRRIATAGNDGQIVIRDPESLEALLELREHEMYVMNLSFSPDGRVLASASGDGTVRLWDTTPASDRYREALASKSLEGEVSPRVQALEASGEGIEEAIREAWPEDAEKRQAARRVLARRSRPRESGD